MTSRMTVGRLPARRTVTAIGLVGPWALVQCLPPPEPARRAGPVL